MQIPKWMGWVGSAATAFAGMAAKKKLLASDDFKDAVKEFKDRYLEEAQGGRVGPTELVFGKARLKEAWELVVLAQKVLFAKTPGTGAPGST